MCEMSIYWRDWSEKQLAAYQQDQGTSNHCAKFAAATALNLLYGSSLSGDDLVAWLQAHFLRGTFLYTIFGNNNGSFVYQTGNLIRLLARQHGLHPSIELRIGNLPSIKNLIKDNNSLAIVSLTYFQDHEPVIAYGTNTSSSLGKTRWVGGHLMISAAYDASHTNQSGTATPWGFISSWKGKNFLYWMTEEDFQRSWGRLSIYNMVVIRRKT